MSSENWWGHHTFLKHALERQLQACSMALLSQSSNKDTFDFETNAHVINTALVGCIWATEWVLDNLSPTSQANDLLDTIAKIESPSVRLTVSNPIALRANRDPLNPADKSLSKKWLEPFGVHYFNLNSDFLVMKRRLQALMATGQTTFASERTLAVLEVLEDCARRVRVHMPSYSEVRIRVD